MEYETKYIDENKWRVELEALTREYERMLDFIEQELKTAPEGRLEVRVTRYGVQYSVVLSGKRQYLSKKEVETIKQLAQKNYYEKTSRTLKKAIKRNRAILETKDNKTVGEIYRKMIEARRELITPLTSSLNEFIERWSKVSYESKPFEDGDTEHYAKNGLRVRSKSEAIIIDLLLEYGIPFRYESPLHLKGMGQIYPDFIVINKRTGEEFVWEHFGMVDDWKYANEMVKRVETYHYNGYFEGKNFIYTLESSRHPFGARDAKRIIEQYLL